MTTLPWLVLAFCLSAYGLLKLHRWHHRRQVHRIIRQRLMDLEQYGWEQRRKAWALSKGDGIKPVRQRF